jgi:hypothetical protein
MDEEQENQSANSQFEIDSELIEGSISEESENTEKQNKDDKEHDLDG